MTDDSRDGIGAFLSAFTEDLAKRIGKVVARELRGEDPSLVEQALSPLGRRRHINAVRRRMSERKPGAFMRGRRFLLSQEALAEELGRPEPDPETPGPNGRGPKPGLRKTRGSKPKESEPEEELLASLKRAGLRN